MLTMIESPNRLERMSSEVSISDICINAFEYYDSNKRYSKLCGRNSLLLEMDAGVIEVEEE